MATKVVIQKIDLDTCLTALLLDLTGQEAIRISSGPATLVELADPEVICIEAGGDGDFYLNNFDHHNPYRRLPPACCQAFTLLAAPSPFLNRLTHYVRLVDVASPHLPKISFPSLSNLFSGMLLVEKQPLQQFQCGLKILRLVVERQLDPFSSLPECSEWEGYLQAKKHNSERFSDHFESAVYYISSQGHKIGYLAGCTDAAPVIGGTHAFYAKGCQIAVLFSPYWGNKPLRKFTISTNGLNLSPLLESLSTLEAGWGGRDTIIGSPRNGSSLAESVVLNLVMERL